MASLVANYGFDGVDLDWEPFDAGDHAALQALVTDLHAALPATLVTMPVGCENNNSPDDLTFFGTLAASVDRLNLMSYGLAGAWQGWKSWHSSPLHWNGDTSTPIAIDSSVDDYLAAGVPAAKLGIGSGFYGECYTSPVTAPDLALGGSTVAAGDGTMSYANILAGYYSATAYHWDSSAMVPYLSFPLAHGAQGCTYVTYEDALAIAAKGRVREVEGTGRRHHLDDQRRLRALGRRRTEKPAARGDEDGVPAVGVPARAPAPSPYAGRSFSNTSIILSSGPTSCQRLTSAWSIALAPGQSGRVRSASSRMSVRAP